MNQRLNHAQQSRELFKKFSDLSAVLVWTEAATTLPEASVSDERYQRMCIRISEKEISGHDKTGLKPSLSPRRIHLSTLTRKGDAI